MFKISCILLHVVLLIVIVSSGITTAEEITVNAVAALMRCHEKFLLEGISLPVKHAEDGFFQMEPYFRIEESIETCLNSLKKKFHKDQQVSKIIILHTELVAENKWLKEQKREIKARLEKIKIEQAANNSEKNRQLEDWRKRLVALGLAEKALFYHIANGLVKTILFPFFDREKQAHVKHVNVERYRQMQRFLQDTVDNLNILLKDKAHNDDHKVLFPYEKFVEQVKSVNERVTNVVEQKQDTYIHDHVWWSSQDNAPKARRVLWVVRHAERLDNIPLGRILRDKDTAHSVSILDKIYKKEKRLFWWDNSPLSPRGKKKQAVKLEPVFKHIPIKVIFASPLERTVDTAHGLLGKSHSAELKIKLEPGFIERLDFCTHPPSYQTCGNLSKETGYDRLDCDYKSLFRKPLPPTSDKNEPQKGDLDLPATELPDFQKETLLLPSGQEGFESNEDDCLDRIDSALDYLLGYFTEAGLKKKRGIKPKKTVYFTTENQRQKAKEQSQQRRRQQQQLQKEEDEDEKAEPTAGEKKVIMYKRQKLNEKSPQQPQVEEEEAKKKFGEEKDEQAAGNENVAQEEREEQGEQHGKENAEGGHAPMDFLLAAVDAASSSDSSISASSSTSSASSAPDIPSDSSASSNWLWPGEEDAEHIVIVSHGAAIGAIHQLISGMWAYVPQASISKFVEFEQPQQPPKADAEPQVVVAANGGGKKRKKGKEGKRKSAVPEFKNFRLIYTGETKHLGEEREHNLRSY